MSGQPPLFAAEDDAEAVVVAERGVGQLRDVSGGELLEHMTAADGRGGDAQIHIGKRFFQCVGAARRAHDILRAFRPPFRNVVDALRTIADDAHIGDREIFHRPRCGADVAGLVWLDENDPYLHGARIARLQ